MKIVARYASKCGVCGQSIDIGDFVEWTKGGDYSAIAVPKPSRLRRSLLLR